MVRIIFYILLFLFSTDAYSQICREKPKPYVSVWGKPRVVKMNLLDREYSNQIHFGFSMGVNVFDFSNIKASGRTVYIPGQGNAILTADLVHIQPGFNLNAIADYRLNRNFNLRFVPGIFFGNRQLEFYRSDIHGQIQSMPVSSNYLEFPVLLKYSANRYSNFRPFVITGFNPRVNLNNGLNVETERYISLVKTEPFAEIGFGFDFYLNYFRMSLEIKLSSGLVNCLSPAEAAGYEYYRQSLSSMRSNMLAFSINFEL